MSGKLSKAGIILSATYLIFTVIILTISLTCSQIYCGTIIILPIVPWLFMLGKTIPDTILSYMLLIILNTIIIYFIGYAIEKQKS